MPSPLARSGCRRSRPRRGSRSLAWPAGYFGADARRVLAGARRPRADPDRPAVGAPTLRAARCAGRARRPRALAARGVRAGRPGRAGAARRARRSASRCTAACCAARSAVPVDLRLGAAERAAVRAGTAPSSSTSRCAGEGGRAPPARAAHDLDATADRRAHLRARAGAPRPVELTYGNWLWSALGSAVALGAATPTSAGSARCRCRTSAACRSCCAARSTAPRRSSTSASTPSACWPRCATRRPTIVSLVPTTLARLLDAGLREPPALRWALLGGAPLPPALLRARRARRASRSPQTYGLTEACSQVDHRRRRRCSARASRLSASGEILVAGPTVAPAARAGRCTPATSARRRRTGAWS